VLAFKKHLSGFTDTFPRQRPVAAMENFQRFCLVILAATYSMPKIGKSQVPIILKKESKSKFKRSEKKNVATLYLGCEPKRNGEKNTMFELF
jgi:hypothetical protein